ncbi:MAG TPA: hypothetical protein VHY08_12085 [Bacillota bacterium]|nr:hypothetical protein [Bacillota bacterium]
MLKKLGWSVILVLLWLITGADLFLNGFKLTTVLTSKDSRIEFSGYQWTVKQNPFRFGAVGPFFFNSTKNVWVDRLGRLHLKIVKIKGVWYGSEVICKQSFGYGKYSFHLTAPVGQLDPNVVLGLFTWSENPFQASREIDIEFSKWGRGLDYNNAQYVIQPWTHSGNRRRFQVSPNLTSSTHCFIWEKKRISFQSLFCDPSRSGTSPRECPRQVLQEWKCRSRDIPAPGDEKVHLNLFLAANRPPSDGREVEIMINEFQFTP